MQETVGSMSASGVPLNKIPKFADTSSDGVSRCLEYCRVSENCCICVLAP